MNLRKWSDPEVPLEIVALKLAEETGEVANIITDNLMAHQGPMREREVGHLIDECEHVIFLASVIKNRALAMPTYLKKP